MLTNGGVAEYQIKSRKMRYLSLDELYRQRDLFEIRFAGRVAPRFARPRSASFADRLRIRIGRRSCSGLTRLKCCFRRMLESR